MLASNGFLSHSASIQLFLPGCHGLLHLTELAQGRFQRRLPFQELPALMLVQLLFGIDLGVELAGFVLLPLEIGLGQIKRGLLLGSLLLIATQLVAHALQARPQRRQHGLLPFESRYTLR